MQACKEEPDTPTGLLVAASKYYQDRDPRCESILDDIRQTPSGSAVPASSSSPTNRSSRSSGALPSAVADVVFAAGWMPKVTAQKELLRAAIYGRTHAPQDIDAALIPLCVLHARVLNTLHNGSGVRLWRCKKWEFQPRLWCRGLLYHKRRKRRSSAKIQQREQVKIYHM